MAGIQTLSREDRIAARLAKLGGVALSQDDLEGLRSLEAEDDTGNRATTKGGDGKMSMESILADLLLAQSQVSTCPRIPTRQTSSDAWLPPVHDQDQGS